MSRLLSLALLFLLASPIAAQVGSDFFPIEPGNRWRFEVEGRYPMQVSVQTFEGVVEWSVMDTSAPDSVLIQIAREHASGETDLSTCAISRTQPDRPYYIEQVGGEADVCGPISGLWTAYRWIWIPAAPVQDVEVRTIAVGETELEVQVGQYRGGTSRCTDAQCLDTYTDSFTADLAEGIGPYATSMVFTSSAGTPFGSRRDTVTARLLGAEIGGVFYGSILPVAGESAPIRAPLAVVVGPNPASETVTVWLDRETASEASVEILDALGRVVRQRLVGRDASTRFDVSTLSAGIYVVRIRASGAAAAARLVLAR